MPGVPGITERPHSIHSGGTIQRPMTVQHRSDLIMEEQILVVRDIQEALRKALEELESSKSESLEFHEVRVGDLRAKTEEMVLILQIASKLNTELMYARADLERAIQVGANNINEKRRRVNWLEDRMERLVMKKSPRKMRTPRISTPRRKSSPRKTASPFKPPRIPDDTLKSVQEVSIKDAGYVADYDASHTNEPTSLSETDAPSHLPPLKHVRIESDDEDRTSTKFSRRKRQSPQKMERTETELSVQQTKKLTEKNQAQLQLTYQNRLVPEKTETSIYPASSVTEYESDEERSSSSAASDGTKVSSPPSSAPPSPIVKEESEQEDDDDEKSEDEELKSEQSDSRPESAASSHLTSVTQGSQTAITPRAGPTFLTDMTQSARTRVTIKSPETLHEEPVDDEVEDYWSSEHHRFEYGEFADALTETNPLSYHQVGLALPGTFLDRPDNSETQLPWRPPSGGIYDVHQIAMDNLSQRIRKISEKVYDAAMLSVDRKYLQTETAGPPKLSLLSRERTVSSKPGMKRVTGVSRPATDDTNILPPLEQQRLGTSQSGTGRLIFYPKPIPPPEHMPVSRVRRDLRYPRLPDNFAEPDLERGPAERIVDQRNLFEETKFKLYRGKAKAKTPGPNSPQKYSSDVPLQSAPSINSDMEQDTDSAQKKFRLMAKTLGKFKGLMDRLSAPQDEHDIGPGPFVTKKASSTNDWESPTSNWAKMKPKSSALQHTGVKWERVKDIVHSSLISPHVDERKDAAMHLGLLKSGDAMVIFALKERLKQDEDEQVRYNVTKTLATLGCWEEDVLSSIVDYLTLGNTEIRIDLIRNVSNGKNVQYVDKSLESFPELIKLLSHFCRHPDPLDQVAFEAAICIGKLCVPDKSARDKMRQVIEDSDDTHTKYQALEILVRQLNHKDDTVIDAVLNQLSRSPVWRYRVAAAKLLTHIGTRYVCSEKNGEKVFDLLVRRLWDDPNKDVRHAVAKTINALNLFSKACDRVEKRLEDPNEDHRAHAIISLGTLGVKSDRIIRALVEMLELDSSEYVRLMVIRTFASLELQDKRVIRALREKERGEGNLARESAKALKQLLSEPKDLIKISCEKDTGKLLCGGICCRRNATSNIGNIKPEDLGIYDSAYIKCYLSTKLDLHRYPGY